MKIRVYYEDTDAGGVVYHSQYLNFCERARSEIFFKNGLSPHQENEFFVVKNIQADFIKSAKFADILDIKTTIIERKKASLRLHQTVTSQDNQLLFAMDVQVVYLKNGKPSKIPEKFQSLFSLNN